MTNQEVMEIIRVETSKIVEHLLSEYKITLKEIKETQYGIKYEVKNEVSGVAGVLVIYYGKKGYKFVNEKVGCQDSHAKVVEVFNNRDNLLTIKVKEITEEIKIKTTYLEKLYKIFKIYDNEEFDFSIFAEELLKHCNNDNLKVIVKENIYNFNELERIYKKVIERE